MNNFKEEAERRYPEYQHGKDLDSATVNAENYWVQGFRNIFISGADFGYQQGIEQGMRFAEWVGSERWYYVAYPQYNTWGKTGRYFKGHTLDTQYKTTEELYEIFKKEQP